MTSSVDLTQDLVRFNTINPPGAEGSCAEALVTLLKDGGFTVDTVPFGEGRAQIVARIGGASGNLPIGFTGHLDTGNDLRAAFAEWHCVDREAPIFQQSNKRRS